MRRSSSSEVSLATARIDAEFPDMGAVVWQARLVCLRTSARTKTRTGSPARLSWGNFRVGRQGVEP
jgi:hypothetical protein